MKSESRESEETLLFCCLNLFVERAARVLWKMTEVKQQVIHGLDYDDGDTQMSSGGGADASKAHSSAAEELCRRYPFITLVSVLQGDTERWTPHDHAKLIEIAPEWKTLRADIFGTTTGAISTAVMDRLRELPALTAPAGIAAGSKGIYAVRLPTTVAAQLGMVVALSEDRDWDGVIPHKGALPCTLVLLCYFLDELHSKSPLQENLAANLKNMHNAYLVEAGMNKQQLVFAEAVCALGELTALLNLSNSKSSPHLVLFLTAATARAARAEIRRARVAASTVSKDRSGYSGVGAGGSRAALSAQEAPLSNSSVKAGLLSLFATQTRLWHAACAAALSKIDPIIEERKA